MNKIKALAHTKLRMLALAAAVPVLAVSAAAVHYVMPRGEVVVVTDTDVMRFDGGIDSSAFDAKSDISNSRDVRLIAARPVDGKGVRTYRNEDAIWYGKFDSGTIHSQVKSILHDQSRGTEVPVLVEYYGWRIEFRSLYPNVISLKRVPADYSYFPWTAVVMSAVLAAALGALAWGALWLKRRAVAAVAAAAERVAAARDDLASRLGPAKAPAATGPDARRQPPDVSSER